MSRGEDIEQIDPGRLVVPGPLGSGWIVFCKYVNDSGSAISSFTTRWTVPDPPSTDSSQTVFLFNAMLDAGEETIVQPVLQWGTSVVGGGPFWTISNWHIAPSGEVFHSDAVQVQPRDSLVGSITLTGSDNGFDYVSEFLGKPSTRIVVAGIGELMKCTETLEAHGITLCSDYPASAATSFTAIDIQTGATPPHVSWTVVDKVTDCRQRAQLVVDSGANGAITLHYPTG